jgi:ComF family protein
LNEQPLRKNEIRERLGKFLEGMAEDLACFLFPPQCIICGKALPHGRNVACEDCQRSVFNIHKTVMPYCPQCGLLYSRYFDKCRQCGGRKSPGKVYSLAGITPEFRSFLHVFKYAGRIEIGRRFAEKAFELYGDEGLFNDIDMIIPVPLHRRKRLNRGYNQAEVLASHLGELLELPVDMRSLRRKLPTKSQTRMDARQRFANVRGAFEVRDRDTVKGMRILLVDDIITTGATLYECSRTLRKAGAGQVISFTAGRPLIKDEY